jgi:hypothetical protein
VTRVTTIDSAEKDWALERLKIAIPKLFEREECAIFPASLWEGALKEHRHSGNAPRLEKVPS